MPSSVKVSVPTDLKVQRVHKKVNSAFKVFVKAHAKVAKAISKMESIVKTSEDRIAEITLEFETEVKHKEQALEAMAQHNEMLEKISNFLPNKP